MGIDRSAEERKGSLNELSLTGLPREQAISQWQEKIYFVSF
jgi:hypothetical protein